MMLRSVPLALAAASLAACTVPPDSQADVRAPAVTVAGAPVNCIQTSRIQSTRVHDDYTIDFDMLGDEVYRNTLPNRCTSLGFEERFSHSSTTGQLCSVDTITVLYSDSRPGQTCGLGEFVPVRYVDDDDND